MEDLLLHEGLAAVWRVVDRGNAFVDQRAPWKLAKQPDKRVELGHTLTTLAKLLAQCTLLVAPFMPQKAQELWQQLGAPGSVTEQRLDALRDLDPSGWRVSKGAPLFPKEQPQKEGAPA
jgi:methionyl-tRNA synthetase